MTLPTIIDHLKSLHSHMIEHDFSTSSEDAALAEAINHLKRLDGQHTHNCGRTGSRRVAVANCAMDCACWCHKPEYGAKA